MVTRNYLPRMAVGYQPTCMSGPGLWPCYPIMPKYGLRSMGAAYPVIPRYGVSGLTFDNTGLFGTGLLGSGSWDFWDYAFLALGIYGIYAIFFRAKQQVKAGYLGLEGRAQKRRVARAAKYRAKAKRLEAKGLGGIFA